MMVTRTKHILSALQIFRVDNFQYRQQKNLVWPGRMNDSPNSFLSKWLILPLVLLWLHGAQAALSAFNDYSQIAVDQDTVARNIVARDDSASLNKLDRQISGNVNTNDTGALSTRLDSNPSGIYGSISLLADGSYTYTIYSNNSELANLHENEYRQESFQYSIIGDRGHESTAKITFTIYGNTYNTDVIAYPDEFGLYAQDAEISGNVTANDTGAITASLLTSNNGSCGKLTFDSAGAFIYKPKTGLNADCSDIFSYQITGNNGYTSQSTLKVTVLSNTVVDKNFYALNDSASIVVRTTTPVTGNVTINDGGFKTAILLSQPSTDYGVLSFDSSGAYTYQLHGSVDLPTGTTYVDTFQYQIENELGDKRTAYLYISIIGKNKEQGNTADFYAVDDNASVVVRDTTPISGNVTGNDSSFKTAALLSQPSTNYGILTFDSTGAYTYQLNSSVDLPTGTTYVDSFQYQIENELGETRTAYLNISIVGKNKDQGNTIDFYALDDSASIVVRTTTPISGNVTTNDLGYKTVSLISQPSTNYGTLTFDSTGAYSYQLHSTVNLSTGTTYVDSFQYQIENELGDTRTAYLNISIIGKNKEQENIADFYAIDDVNNITRSVNAETSTVSGNVLDNDSGYKTSTLLSPVISQYGSLQYSSDGNYTYTLFNGAAAIQALDYNEFLTDEFTYQIEHESGATKTATLKINIFGAQGSVNVDVEIEPNNRRNEATTIITGDTNQKKEIRGHLLSGLDKDWFQITGKNEIIHLEICPPESSCYNQKAWVLYVFDSDVLTDTMEQATIPFTLTGDKTGELLSTTDGTLSNNHMYLNYDFGNFGESLIGIIDPCYGNTTGVDIGVGDTEKTYYVAVSSPLARNSTKDGPEDSCTGGSTLLKRSGPTHTYTDSSGSETEETTTQTGIAIFPNSDDQYILSVTRTGVDPVKDTSVPASRLSRSQDSLNIPLLRVNQDYYQVNLAVQNTSTRSSRSPVRFNIRDYQKLSQDSVNTLYSATFNPQTRLIKVPKYIDESSQKLYSLVLLYYPPIGNSDPLLELIDVTPLD